MRITLEALEDGKLDSMTFRPPYDYACCIYATSPMLRVEDLHCAFCQLADRGAHYAFAVGTEPLHDAGMFYFGKVSSFLKGESLYGPDSIIVPIPSNRVCDINTLEDWGRAERMFAELNGIAA
jgi:N-acylneuraminate cytidylyltransferase